MFRERADQLEQISLSLSLFVIPLFSFIFHYSTSALSTYLSLPRSLSNSTFLSLFLPFDLRLIIVSPSFLHPFIYLALSRVLAISLFPVGTLDPPV